MKIKTAEIISSSEINNEESDKREAKDAAVPEIINAMQAVLLKQIARTQSNLIEETAKISEYSRKSKQIICSAAESSIEMALVSQQTAKDANESFIVFSD